MLNIARVLKPWKEAASLNAQINLYGFWDATTFLTKSGDLGVVLRVGGVDYESLDTGEQEYAVKRLEAALKAFGPGFRVYQYLFKKNRPEMPFAHYEDAVVATAVEQRRQYFEQKRDYLYTVEIYYSILLEGSRSKAGVGAGLSRLISDPAGGLSELRAQFSNGSMKTLLRSQIDQDRARLHQRVLAFVRQLADFVSIEVLDQRGELHFFRRLLNFDDWRIAGSPQATQFLDYQVTNSHIEAERDHLRIGDHFVRVLTMKEAIAETRPLVLDALLKIPANFHVVTEWVPLPMAKARKEVNKRRRHFNLSKTGYFRTAVASAVHRTDKYAMLIVADGAKRSRAARDSDVIAGSTAQIGEKPIPLQLSEPARASGLLFLYRAPKTEYLNKPLYNYFHSTLYGGESMGEIFRLPLSFGVAVLLLQLPLSIQKDIKRYKEMKYGRRLKGPVLVSPREFNSAVQGDGIGFKTLETEAMMRVPLGAEGQHIELMGDTGAGKTTLIMQVLRQIQSRGESAIIYDPACEFIQRFYDRDREDIILNPLDARCPYWGPSEELRRRAEAKAIAASLYQPTTDRKGEFFVETPQKIFAHLLTFGPTPQQLVHWMANPEEIDRRVEGTEMASMIAKGAQQQRNGVLASLGLIADSLRMLPPKEKADSAWSATEWSESGKGGSLSRPNQASAKRFVRCIAYGSTCSSYDC